MNHAHAIQFVGGSFCSAIPGGDTWRRFHHLQRVGLLDTSQHEEHRAQLQNPKLLDLHLSARLRQFLVMGSRKKETMENSSPTFYGRKERSTKFAFSRKNHHAREELLPRIELGKTEQTVILTSNG